MHDVLVKKTNSNFKVVAMHDDHISWGLHCHSRFDDLDLVSRSQVCQKCKLQIGYFGVSSCVVYMLYGCYIH